MPLQQFLQVFLLGPIILCGFTVVFLFKPLTYPFIVVNKVLTLILTFAAKLSTQIPFISYTVVTPRMPLVFIYYILLFTSNYIYSIYNTEKFMLSNMNKKILDTLNGIKKRINKVDKKKVIIAIAIFLLVIQIPKILPNDLKIYFIDVGQGDSSLILTPQNKAILIDGGGSGDNEQYDVGKQVLLPYLLDRRVNKLDYIIVSHFDSDHVRTEF